MTIDVEYIDSYRLGLGGIEVKEKWFELLQLKYRDIGCDAGAIFRWENGSRHLRLSAGSWKHVDLESGIPLDLAVFSNVWNRLERDGLVLMKLSSTAKEHADDRQWCPLLGVTACIVLPIRSQGNQPAVAVFGRWQGEL